MESIQRIVVLVMIWKIFITYLASAQDQQGFISLDCGLPSNESSYTEQTTGLVFSSEDGYIHSGKSGIIKIDDDEDFQYIKPYRSLRYFTEGTRNCYNLTLTQGTQYIIRALFVYGNYDGLKSRPKFDLYIGPNIWATINFQDLLASNVLGEGIMEESIHMAKSNSLDICVVKTGTTTPFISALELRPLKDDTYITETGSVTLISREYPTASKPSIRYPGDVHDRYWRPSSWDDYMYLNNTAAGDPPNAYEIPKAIYTSYARPQDSNKTLTAGWSSQKLTGQVYVYLHFAEMQALKPKYTREFNILWDDDILMYSDYSPPEFMVDTVSFTQTCKSPFCFLELAKTKRSNFPPLLNGIEVFVVIPFLQTDTDENDVIAIKNIKANSKISRISWQGDPCAPVEYMWDGLNCSGKTEVSSAPPRIISLDLSSSGLSGTIPRQIGDLSQLQKLDLSNNSFTGGIPEFLASLKSLTVINLSWNNFSGSVPKSLRDMEKKGLKLIVQGNSKLCSSPACESEGNNKKEWLVPVVASVSALTVVTVVLILIFYIYGSKRQSKALRPSIVANKIRFTREEVTAMTNNFERVLGEGGFGVVYHGYLNGNKQVAVKVLSQSSAQGYRQFKAEVELLLRVHHTNLVALVGYCDEINYMVLIYDYMPNGDLKQHLSEECATSSLSWARRLRIAADTAQGLEYLHNGCKPPMIHRDVKTMNILLDEHFQAKLGDFGLSKSFPIGSKTHVSTNVAGSPGYLDPEYYKTNRLTEKSDIFSFGVVLLELITSRSVIDQTREKPHIAEWVAFMLTNRDIDNIVDPSLMGDYDSISLWKALELAMSCVNPSASERPNMSQVATELKECLLNENLRKEGASDIDSKSSLGPGSI
ncbi:unnamed protein product [Microthlaspi erraticum]|uniref:non-specific serine/threonine protein kinase n=1 Tax=Microthlaspi erraticum TaxID=1685480 RepID=A0A6D2K827_9BRAS|nr:unnamed protein product [Microthlaspi erraticum]